MIKGLLLSFVTSKKASPFNFTVRSLFENSAGYSMLLFGLRIITVPSSNTTRLVGSCSLEFFYERRYFNNETVSREGNPFCLKRIAPRPITAMAVMAAANLKGVFKKNEVLVCDGSCLCVVPLC